MSRQMHDAVAEKAAMGLKAIYKAWRERKKVPPFIIAWPLPSLSFSYCLPTDNEVVVDLPESRESWPMLISELIGRTDPFALLLAQQKEDEVVLVLESEFGSSSWHIPIKRHGHEAVLGQPTKKTDIDSLGLLWKAGPKN